MAKCAVRHTALTAPLVLHLTRIGKYTMKNFYINGQWRNKLFFIVIHRFSLVKVAMNAPRVCTENSAKTVLTALTSAYWCYQKSIKRRIYDCKLRNEKKSLFQVRYEFTTHI
jgi:hypothetical protein